MTSRRSRRPRRSGCSTWRSASARSGPSTASRSRSAPGEFFSLLGPSGCGKTTTLRMIGGFELPDRRPILLRGRDMTNDPPDKRPVNMVFQNYALFPHLDVGDNVAFGLKRRSTSPRPRSRRRVGEALELVHLDRLRAAQAEPAVRRPAAARRAGPGARQPAQRAAPRRAARRARPQAPQAASSSSSSASRPRSGSRSCT